MSVIDRIVAQNNALWALLTDHTLTREQQLECIERAFPKRTEPDASAELDEMRARIGRESD